MKFYNREPELEQLNQLDQQAKNAAIMTVLTGRRRIGKTELALHFSKSKTFIYLFVGRKSEQLLCEEFLLDIQQVFDVPVIGKITQFKEIFALLLEIAKKQAFTLIIDEFQDFYKINTAIFSDIQKLWDLNKKNSKLHVIFSGSLYSLMHKIFENNKEPLFGRADQIFYLKQFSIATLTTVLKDHKICNKQNLFDFYLTTGCTPKYIDLLLKRNVTNFEEMLNAILMPDSLFLNEGRNVLIEEFGKSYATYFSILELIARGKNTRSEIESYIDKDVGGYLEKLDKDYNIISSYKSITAKPKARLQRYRIHDQFLKFWFHFIYTNRSAIEMGNFKYVKSSICKNYQTYSGRVLEDFFHIKFAETGHYNCVGHYWEKGFQNEIDLVATNDLQKRLVIAEIKLNKKKISLNKLKEKSNGLLEHFKGYETEFLALGIDDI